MWIYIYMCIYIYMYAYVYSDYSILLLRTKKGGYFPFSEMYPAFSAREKYNDGE